MPNNKLKHYQSVSTFMLSAFVLFALALPASAKDIPSRKPSREGISQERLDRITDQMNKAVEDGAMVGGLGLIARNGKVVYRETYGMSDRESNKKMEDDTLFRIYSMSKPITSVALMMLYEEGKFFLKDPVAKYIPELANLQVAVSTADGETSIVSDGTITKTIGEGDKSKEGQTRQPARQPTIRDLMLHTSGMTYGFFGKTEVDKLYMKNAAMMAPNSDLKKFVSGLGKLPLQYEPGTKWHYSVSVDVQGRLVEVLSGMSFGEFLEKRIFQPLDMQDTFFRVPKNKLARFAQMYSPSAKGLVPSPAQSSYSYMEGATFESGGGGLVSTAMDYLKFSQMMLNGGQLNGKRLLSPKTVELMTANHLAGLPMGDNPGVGFGLGFGISLDQGTVGEAGSTGSYSWGGAAGTKFWIDPQENLIGIFMVQNFPPVVDVGEKFKVMTYQTIVK
ncbi:serine hydrolase [uncultured Paraglaciecola sp.]|uniref:serine hydrolase domain-containing protein n=1 Tax=uncultured Paraglaciecola sp. TaxID=1765024 RepID=UPI0026272D6C|nr:serine hydrolase domain-containing protein [uncultured Paraglaciecola sp.]